MLLPSLRDSATYAWRRSIQVKRIAILILMVVVCALVSSARDQSSDFKRPLITGVAHIAFQVGDLAKARAFYGELLGYDEVFQIPESESSSLMTCFKVNERQYIKILPGLPADKDD